MRPDRKGVLPIRLFALVCLLVIADQISKAVVRAILPRGVGFVGVVASVSGHLLDDFLMPFTTDFSL
jgi:hypothetical protein